MTGDSKGFSCFAAFLPLLLRLQHLVDHHFTLLVCDDDFVYGHVSGQGDVDLVVARIDQRIHRRILIEHVLVDGNLSAFGLGMNADGRLARIALAAAEQL